MKKFKGDADTFLASFPHLSLGTIDILLGDHLPTGLGASWGKVCSLLIFVAMSPGLQVSLNVYWWYE